MNRNQEGQAPVSNGLSMHAAISKGTIKAQPLVGFVVIISVCVCVRVHIRMSEVYTGHLSLLRSVLIFKAGSLWEPGAHL